MTYSKSFSKGIMVLLLVSFSSVGAAQAPSLSNRLLLASPYAIEVDEELTSYMTHLAESTIAESCQDCHGSDLEGQLGVPNLVDYDWLWGVTGLEMNSVEPVMEIMQTILYGVRNEDCPEDIKQYGACPDTRFSQMPGYGAQRYSEKEINDFVEYVVNLSGGEADEAAVARISDQWLVCAECHGEQGYGYKPFGGPDLSDDIWLFGNSREQIYDVIYHGRTQKCPAWSESLDATTIKALAVYIYNKSQQ